MGVKNRIKAVARYKKASFWILLLSVAVCIATVVCFLSDPAACKHSYGQPAELLSHSYDAGTVTLAATCTQCGRILVTEPLPTDDVHDLEETVVRAATCTEPGEGVSQCTRCDYSESCIYPMLWHNYEEKLIEEGTCKKSEVYEGTCTRCGHSYTSYGFTGWHKMVEYSNYNQCEYCGYRTNKIPTQSPPGGTTGSTPTFPVISIDPIWNPDKNRFEVP